MSSENLNRENSVPLLPFGETLRPLILASSLKRFDLRFVLQKRGIFVPSSRNDETVPVLTSILLSPREFEILKNRQRLRESTPKTSDAKTNWGAEETIVQSMPNESESFVQSLVDENSSYRLTDCSVQTIDTNHVVINCSIERQDWTKDAFSSTTYHDCSLSISKNPENDIVTYYTETTVPETKDLMHKLQNALHSHFCQQGVILKNTPIQRILASHFFDSKIRYEFLYTFITQTLDSLFFQRIVDIDAGIDHNLPDFPEDFNWLKGNIDMIDLRGKGVHLTAILQLGEIGVLVFGEIEAEFRFEYTEAKGTCTIRYGFPNYYKNGRQTEFEAEVVNLTLHPSYVHVPKKRVSKYLLQQFQGNKHFRFDEFVDEEKADPRKRSLQNQYQFEGEEWN